MTLRPRAPPIPVLHGVDLKRALIAASAYFLALFTLGFVLGTIRVTWITPQVGPLAATLAEIPLMLLAAWFLCRWAIRRWRVPETPLIRWTMVPWFLALLIMFEALIGATLFGRTMADQWSALTTPAGILGLSAQIVAAFLPVFASKQQ